MHVKRLIQSLWTVTSQPNSPRPLPEFNRLSPNRRLLPYKYHPNTTYMSAFLLQKMSDARTTELFLVLTMLGLCGCQAHEASFSQKYATQ